MKNNNAQSGFTLVEMMVSIAIFMVVAVVAVAALLKIVDANKKSETLQDTVNNINFAMDSITREIRVGSNYNGYSGQYTGSGLGQQSQAFSDSCIETGGAQNCSGTNPGSSPSIVFFSSNRDSTNSCNLTYAYNFAQNPNPSFPKDWTITKAQQTNCTDTLGSSNALYAPIIDPSIIITSFSVKVSALTPGTAQPSVFLYIHGYTGNADKTKTFFDVQTTISERI
ncbi:MAG: type II secretion system protein [Candidatus Pacebacteria bacterium]|nr:type II secretion system protein [Candidatus Paceibacterota bacterium]